MDFNRGTEGGPCRDRRTRNAENDSKYCRNRFHASGIVSVFGFRPDFGRSENLINDD
jgi:hypothetical protein